MYHGPEGLKAIAAHCRLSAATALAGWRSKPHAGGAVGVKDYFDTIAVHPPAGVDVDAVLSTGHALGINLRKLDATTLTIAMDETTSAADLDLVFKAFPSAATCPSRRRRSPAATGCLPSRRRSSAPRSL